MKAFTLKADTVTHTVSPPLSLFPSSHTHTQAYATLNDIVLSTSTLASPALDAGGFGPVGDKCYAIGYGITDDGARFYVMSNHLQTEQFADALLSSAKEMRKVIEDASA